MSCFLLGIGGPNFDPPCQLQSSDVLGRELKECVAFLVIAVGLPATINWAAVITLW